MSISYIKERRTPNLDKVIKQIEIDVYTPTFYEVIKAQQGDNNSRFVEFILYNQGDPYTIPSNVIIKLEGLRPNKSPIIKPCTFKDNIITVELDADLLYYHGISYLKIVLYELDEYTVLSTIPFTLSVQKNPLDNDKFEEDNYSLLNQLILETETNTKNLANEIERAKKAEGDLNFNKVDKTTVATSSTLGLIKSGTDITVDSSGNVSVNDNSHKHTVSNISDLTATASELNVLDGITASTTELNYTDGATGNIQTQLNAKAPLASPTLTGIPKAPTASSGTNTTQIATTAFVQTAVSNHNTSTTAHSDIRDLISELTARLNALADSDDTTLDQLSEIVAYIKSNRTLIENVTTNKVNVTDIVDNLTSTATNKPLSAKQGKILNNLISTLTEAANTKIDTINGDSFISVSKSGTTAAITHKDVSRTNTTSTTSPTSGGTFTAVKSVTSDSKGHVIGIDTETITLPNTAVTVDSELSSTSTNPIQNKVLVNALNEKANTEHTHGLLHSNLSCIISNTTTDSGWSMINSPYKGFLLKSIRTNSNAPSWILGNFSAGIAFGGDDTKGVISVSYDTPGIRFTGGNGTAPCWWLGITGTSGTTYNLNNFSSSSHNHDSTYLKLSGGTVSGDTTFNSRLYAKGGGIEIYCATTPYIDFHYANSTADYTSRIMETSSGALAATGSFSASTFYTEDWFRSTGNSGWYNETYGGGIYMMDTTWVRTHNNKSFYSGTGQVRADGGLCTINAEANGALAGLTIQNNNSCFRIRNDGSATYLMNGNSSGWTNYIVIYQDGNCAFPGNISGAALYTSYAKNVTTTANPNCYISTEGMISRTSTTSSKRFKDDINTELIDELNPDKLYDLPVVQFKYKKDYFTNKEDIRYQKDMIGFIAEDVYDLYPIAADYHYDENGEVAVDGWNDKFIIPAMLKLIQEQNGRIKQLENSIKTNIKSI